MKKTHLLLFISFFTLFVTSRLGAQVKIGNPPGAPDPKAVLELSDTARGFLLPRLNNSQMNAINLPPDGLLIYNNERRSVYQYRQAAGQWSPLVADSSEWVIDSASTRLYLRRGLQANDTIFYRGNKKMFFFGDTRMYGTSSGGVFNLDDSNYDRFIFKTTASRFFRDTVNLNSANIYSVYEIDNDTVGHNRPFETIFTGLGTDVTVTPSATQKIGMITGLRSFTTFAGKDSLELMYGINNALSIRGKTNIQQVVGINNSTTIRDSIGTIDLLFGIFNSAGYVSPLGTPRVAGDYYGYYGTMSTAFTNKVDGRAFAIHLRNVTAAAPGNNFAFYSNKGLNRFGDSVLVTDQLPFTKPRAVFDINSPGAMIMPAGTTLQRPASGISGMMRYNSDIQAPEFYNGSSWNSMKNSVLSTMASIDVPAIAPGNTVIVTVIIPGVATGNTVTIAPAVNLPNGMFIAWARASAVNEITVSFGNTSAAVIDQPFTIYDIKVIQ